MGLPWNSDESLRKDGSVPPCRRDLYPSSRSANSIELHYGVDRFLEVRYDVSGFNSAENVASERKVMGVGLDKVLDIFRVKVSVPGFEPAVGIDRVEVNVHITRGLVTAAHVEYHGLSKLPFF